jgi:hypothetical protein
MIKPIFIKVFIGINMQLGFGSWDKTLPPTNQRQYSQRLAVTNCGCHLVSQYLMQTLKLLCKSLETCDVRWVLAGSLSLALQGVNVEPHDIDLLTDRQGAFRINAMLKKYEKKKVDYSETEKVSSFLGVFEIQGVKVEVMGDYRERQGTKWVSLSKRLAKPKIIEVDGMRIPVSPLEDQLVSYRRSTRPKDVEKVRRISQR